MGTASSKFKKYLQHGDEFAAMQVFQSSGDLRRHLDPNTSYGENHNHNTPLHYASNHGMKHLLRTFLNDLGGNPNKRNAFDETVLHAACNLEPNKWFSAQERRAACVSLILQWRGPDLNNGCQERVDLQSQDQKGDTALHCAAGSGLKRCVELLLSHGSPLFVENHEHLTPCDVAVRAQHHDIAALLESRMVFADSNDTVNEAELNGGSEPDEVYSGLRTQDLQEAKDQLLVETSDMLHIPLFTAEAVLRDNEWSRETLLDKWMKDPVHCCQSAGVQPPPSALETSSSMFCRTRPFRSPSVVEESNSCDEEVVEGGSGSKDTPRSPAIRSIQSTSEEDYKDEEVECSICMQAVSSLAMLEQGTMSCGHRFCSMCWESYLTLKIQEGDAHHISCPEYNCDILVPVEVIEKSVTPEVARRYLQFDIKAFVESSRCIKWCPRPGCGQAVRLPETEQTPPPNQSAAPTSHAVDCGNGHFFCWECLGEVHAPSGCEQWQQWQRKIAEVKPEELPSSGMDIEDAANCLWLVTNSKPCPNCKSPIQKNEGCNHMKCSKCKLDFCWVCLESWKKHSSSTGGYFRCNRFEAVNKADERQGVLISEAMQRNQQATELSRFLHYYTRFRNHENSQRLEEPLLNSAPAKMALLAACLTPNRSPGEEGKIERGTQFVASGVRELLKARRILCGSYVYGYYLQDNGYNKSIFEFMQNELEEVTEKLSEQIARPYLRTPRSLIIQTTALVRRKRHEFIRAVNKGLIPPETPPLQRKTRKRRFPGVVSPELLDDKEISQAIAASLKEIDPNDTWAKDVLNRHLLQPADYDSDEEPSNPSAAPLALCARFGCVRPCARNARTLSYHQFCSLRCSRAAKLAANTGDAYNLDLVIALEMSRLQMIEDELKRHQQQVSSDAPHLSDNSEPQAISSRPPAPLPVEAETSLDTGAHPHQENLDEQTKLAIHLSLQDSKQERENTEQIRKNECTETNTIIDISGGASLNGFTERMNMDSLTTNSSCQIRERTRVSAWTEPLPEPSSLVGGFKQERGEDGRFEITDIHENGIFNDTVTRNSNDDDEIDNYNHFGEDDSADGRSLKRSHSTGDLVPRRGWGASRRGEPRYHLDSDHSSQHDDKPEEIARRILKAERHTLLLANLHGSGGSTAGSTAESTAGSLAGSTADDTGAEYELQHGTQSSLDDASTACDSINADLEVCGILNSCKPGRKTTEKSSRSFANLAAIGKKPALDLDLEFIDECGSDLTNRAFPTSEQPEEKPTTTVIGNDIDWKKAVPPNSAGSLSAGSSSSTNCYNKHFKTSGAKGTNGVSGLRIRICKSPQLTPLPIPCKPLQETDSSNEYESETGIPKSPTLFISGVSISRTPEPRSPALSVSAAGRQSRSSSLTVPAAPSSPSSIEAEFSPNLSPAPSPSLSRAATAPGTPSPVLSPRPANIQQPNTKSKSASEPEREREMFRFPKSSTDGALSSVLHVQESNLSSDDFHEALFLLERSKAVGSNVVTKKRKKSKKERDKDKENSSGSSGKPLDLMEASSVL